MLSTHPRSNEGRAPRAAFTLIELLTVIAIIGILAAIILPVASRVRETARSAKCVSNLRQISLGIQMYVGDRKGMMPGPVLTAQYANYRQTTTGLRGNLPALIAEYVPVQQGASSLDRVQEMLLCPSWALSTSSQAVPSMMLNTAPVGWLQGNVQIYPMGYAGTTPANDLKPLPFSRITQYPLSQTWLMIDLDKEWFSDGASPGGWGDIPAKPVHGSGRNCLFYDGHVARIGGGERPLNF